MEFLKSVAVSAVLLALCGRARLGVEHGSEFPTMREAVMSDKVIEYRYQNAGGEWSDWEQLWCGDLEDRTVALQAAWQDQRTEFRMRPEVEIGTVYRCQEYDPENVWVKTGAGWRCIDLQTGEVFEDNVVTDHRARNPYPPDAVWRPKSDLIKGEPE